MVCWVLSTERFWGIIGAKSRFEARVVSVHPYARMAVVPDKLVICLWEGPTGLTTRRWTISSLTDSLRPTSGE